MPATATPTPKPKPVKKPAPAAVKIAVTGVGAYDPDGDKSENGQDAGLATDGIATTAWKSEHYRSTFGKSGVGLVLDAGKPRATREPDACDGDTGLQRADPGRLLADRAVHVGVRARSR